MPSYNLLNLSDVLHSWGRGVVLYAPRWSPGDGPLALSHLADTEGDIVINTNPETAGLTTPELTGPAVHEVDYTGENPVIEIPMYLTDPALLSVITPSGSNSAGRSRRSRPIEYTLVIFPEELFLPDQVGAAAPVQNTLALAGGVWTLGGVALDARRLELLDATFWAWRGVFNRPPRTFHGGAGDTKKNIETASFQVMHSGVMPEGHKLYTTGDPMVVSPDPIDIELGS